MGIPERANVNAARPTVSCRVEIVARPSARGKLRSPFGVPAFPQETCESFWSFPLL